MLSKKNVSVVILSAGVSSRMRTDKAFLKVDNEQTFLEKIIKTYTNWGVGEIVVVTNNYQVDKVKSLVFLPENMKVIINEYPDIGRFYSVKLGLHAIRSNSNCFIQNIDNPFTTQKTLNLLFDQMEDDSTIIPVFENRGGHPVLLGTQIKNHILEHEKNDEILKDFLKRYKIKRIEGGTSRILTNINNPGEYDKLLKESV